MTILYCLNYISSTGGVQIVTITKANALSKHVENNVWILACCDDSGRSCIPISESVGIIGIQQRDLTWRQPWVKIQQTFKLPSLIRQFREYLLQIKPDILISTGGFDRWLVPFIKGPWSTVREFHTVKDYRERFSYTPIQKVFASIDGFLENHFFLRRYDRIVVLTEEERAAQWRENKKKVRVIPNPIRFTDTTLSSLKNKRILACGRLCYQKNFSSLVRAIRPVFDRFPDWRLDIIGDGQEYASLQEEITRLSLNNHVFLRGNQANAQDWMADASIFVMTSRSEGFGLVLVEAMSCGLPPVSFACPAGPKDIISDGVDGFLVPPGDEEILSERICALIEDESLRKKMSAAALKKAERYRIPRITEQWMALFEELQQEKKDSII